MLFQLHQYTKKALQQWRQSHKFLLICQSAHLQIDVHCSSHLKKKKKILFMPPIKIIQVLYFFFHSFILSHRALFHHLKLSSLISSHLSHLSHLSHHLSLALISLISQALISLISQALISQPTPSPSPSHAIPADPLQVSALSSFVVNFLIQVFVVLA